jgi:threonine dehydratase
MTTLENIEQAYKVIADKIVKTPLVHSPTLSRMFRCDVFLKLENLQRTGAFKIRGAMYKLLVNADRIPSGGVVAASAGNHAQGVALAAREAGMSSTIVMPEWASISKQEATRNYGGRVIISGQSVEESLEKALVLSGEGRTFIHPFDDPEIIAGQGTIALEILEALRDTDAIVVPVGGGGLIAGIASAAKAVKPGIQIIGVQAAGCTSAHDSFKSGTIKASAATPSIADGINVKQVGCAAFETFHRLVDDIVLVEEEQIAAAILLLLERKKNLAEGAGAAPLAALLGGSLSLPEGSRVVLLISGGNVDSPLLGRIIRQGLLKHGRVIRLRIQLEDAPGALAGLLKIVAQLKANVLHIYHDRDVRGLPIHITEVELELETRSPSHVEAVVRSIEDEGYLLQRR